MPNGHPPNRDAADLFDGNRNYFRRADGLRWWRRLGCVLAALGVAGWVAYELARPSRAAAFHTHGEVAGPHAPWANDCAACHVGYTAADFLADPGSALDARGRWRNVTCVGCHAGPAYRPGGPGHHRNVADADRGFHDACANCHHDHQGADHSLVRLTDDHCTRCHGNLSAHRRPGAGPDLPPGVLAITDFATNHPDFRPLAMDPKDRRLRFSHALHMTPGQAYSPGGKEAMTVGKLRELTGDAAERFVRPGQADGDLVELKCASCHQLDAGQPGGDKDPDRAPFAELTAALGGLPRKALQPDRAGGALYLPVTFEAHCKACHPLRDPTAGFAVPHRLQPANLERLLRGEHQRRLTAEAPPAGPGVVRLPGRFDPRPPRPTPSVRAEADRRAGRGLELFLKGMTAIEAAPPPGPDEYRTPPAPPPPRGYACGKCHVTAGGPAATIAEVPDRTVWLPKATFDHQPHNNLACAACHPGTGAAFAPPGEFVTERERVLIANADTCRACHAPTTYTPQLAGWDRPALGVRHACTDCHRYHDGDHPLRGRGAAARQPVKPVPLAEFGRVGRPEPPVR